jgi:transcriptional regulator with XRE-family HTH domain
MSGSRRVAAREPFPNYFKEWRQFRGLSQTKVEELNNWPATRVSNIETNRATITAHVLMALSKTYRCSVSDLLGRDPNVPRELQETAVSTEEEFGLAGSLQTALATLSTLDAAFKSFQGTIQVQIKTFETQIADAITLVRDALVQGEMLAETVEHFGRTLRRKPDIVVERGGGKVTAIDAKEEPADTVSADGDKPDRDR